MLSQNLYTLTTKVSNQSFQVVWDRNVSWAWVLRLKPGQSRQMRTVSCSVCCRLWESHQGPDLIDLRVHGKQRKETIITVKCYAVNKERSAIRSCREASPEPEKRQSSSRLERYVCSGKRRGEMGAPRCNHKCKGPEAGHHLVRMKTQRLLCLKHGVYTCVHGHMCVFICMLPA